MNSRLDIERQIKKRILTWPDQVQFGSVDLGYGFYKGALAIQDEEGLTIKTSVVPSMCGVGMIEQGLLALDRRRKDNRIHQVVFEGRTLLAGEDVALYSRQGQDMSLGRFAQGSDVVRALTYLTLGNLVGPGIHDLALVVGLPIEVLRSSSAQATVDGITSWLKGEHEFEVDGHAHKIKVIDLRYRSQPAGAFYDWLLNSYGAVRRDDSELKVDGIGVISVGFRTIELFALDDQGNLVARYTDGNDLGIAQCLSVLIASVDQNYNRTLSLHEADAKLRQWSENKGRPVLLGAGGRTYDIEPLIATAWTQYTTQLDELLRRKWENLPFGQVIAVGGGLMLTQDEFASFAPVAYIPDNPVVSIARGLTKLAVKKNTFQALRRWIREKSVALAELKE